MVYNIQPYFFTLLMLFLGSSKELICMQGGSKDSPNNSMFPGPLNQALEDKHLNNIFALLPKEKKNKNEFFTFLDTYILPTIHPEQDHEYLRIKEELAENITKKTTLGIEYQAKNVKPSIQEIFGIESTDQSTLPFAYFTEKIWPLYIKNLLYDSQDNLINVALAVNNFIDVYFLFANIEDNPIAYLTFLKKHALKPNQDNKYLNYKNAIIHSIKKNDEDIANDSNLLAWRLALKYLPPYSKMNDALSKIEDYYFNTILPNYYYDLFTSITPIALRKNNPKTMWSILKFIIISPTIFIKCLNFETDIIKDLFISTYSALNVLFDVTIIDSIRYMINHNKLNITFFKNLQKISLKLPQIQELILRALAYEDNDNVSSLLSFLHKAKIIDNISSIKGELKEYKKVVEIFKKIDSGEIAQAIALIKQVKPKYINIPDDKGKTLLMKVIENNIFDKEHLLNNVETILNAQADINQTEHAGITALMIAVYQNDLDDSIKIELVKFLLDHGANPHQKTVGGNTAFDYAKFRSNNDLIQLLTKYMVHPSTILSHLSSSLQHLSSRAHVKQ